MRFFFLGFLSLTLLNSAGAEGLLPPGKDVPTSWAWYVCDSLGTPLKACGWYDQLSYPYTLAVRQSGDVKWERLWKGKKEIQLVRLVTDSQDHQLQEAVFRGGELDQTFQWDPTNHRLRTWKEYQLGKLVAVHTLDWRGDRLTSQTVQNPSGRILYIDELSYGLDGRLRRVERKAVDGVVLDSAAWTWGPDGVVADSQSFSGSTSLRIHQGNKIEETLSDAVGELLQKVLETGPDGTQTETDLDAQGQVLTKKTFDGRGRLVREDFLTSKIPAYKTWTYDKKDRLVEIEKIAGDDREKTQIVWSGDSRVISTLKNGFLESREVWKDDEKVKEEAFSHGEKVWEEDYENGKRYQTIYFDSSGVVRVRKDHS
ncbi:MAG: hypothetical protein HKM06_00780 [Spirochaetales bacterium]|nr:hypothetical protein [Spirochaetales bacterium]